MRRKIYLAYRAVVRVSKWIAVSVVTAIALVFASNLLLFPTYRHLPSRALSPESASCKDAQAPGWDILAKANSLSKEKEKNDEWFAVDLEGQWKNKLSCSIQHHVVPGYSTTAADGSKVESLSYDLAFIEFQEDGKPYVLRSECSPDADCIRERGIPVRRNGVPQIKPLVDKLKDSVAKGESNYVVVFVHGWRHDASIGDANVQDLQLYAAHAARFLADRAAGNPGLKNPHVTAVYIGWRGARTDENWLKRHVPWLGETIGTLSAVLTLFDRKPVSETVAPAALSALRTIEHTLGIDTYSGELPPKNPNKMIVLGHSLGGNMLVTALQDSLIKKIESHDPGHYMLPVLGDLVVLINPAAEASKWTSIQRALWYKLALINGERRSSADYIKSQKYFRDDQRPIIVSATAARNWPPGGRQQVDCVVQSDRAEARTRENADIQKTVMYDWATHDMFPAFKGDLRPLADRIEQWGTEVDPNDECAQQRVSWFYYFRHPLRTAAVGISGVIRVLPFMVTDPEQTRTIGNLDPPRSLTARLAVYGATMKPLGTTHELRRSEKSFQAGVRKLIEDENKHKKEIPLEYREVISPEAACPAATNWLSRVKTVKLKEEEKSDPQAREHYATGWDTFDLKASTVQGEGFPGLRFIHGFDMGGIAPPTRANDPFWNLRAFDTALAEHNGYLLSSFICAVNQLVLDDITAMGPPR